MQRQVESREVINFSKTQEEKDKVSSAKSSYKAEMRRYFGTNWKKKSRALGYNNVPSN